MIVFNGKIKLNLSLFKVVYYTKRKKKESRSNKRVKIDMVSKEKEYI